MTAANRSIVQGHGDFTTTLRKLWHDKELLEHLEEQQLLDSELAGSGNFFRSLFQAARQGRESKPDRAFEVRLPLGDPRRQLFARLHNTALHQPEQHQRGIQGVSSLLGTADWATAQATFTGRGQAVLDGALSSASLRRLRQQLQEATIYYYPKLGGSFLLGLFEDGLASELIVSIAEALRKALPQILGGLQLCEARAWKADNAAKLPPPLELLPGAATPGLGPGGSAVALLLWVLPVSALNTEEDSASPLLLRGMPTEQVNYAANRAVLWRDDCTQAVPVWRGARFKSGFLRRGLHLVLRFQEPEAPPGSSATESKNQS